MLERWCKWRFELAQAGPAALPRSHPDSGWIDVAKVRLVQRYTVEPPDRVVRVPPGVFPSRGCLLELTEVDITDHLWWTLCFEAYGDVSTLRETYSLVTSHVLAQGVPPWLDTRGSFGYPQFLEQIR
jgi:hypothetical protein